MIFLLKCCPKYEILSHIPIIINGNSFMKLNYVKSCHIQRIDTRKLLKYLCLIVEINSKTKTFDEILSRVESKVKI